jgi:CRP-like cAMP-binding protein
MAESLAQVPLFARLPAATRAALEAAMVDVELAPGRVLFHQGDRAGGTEGLYVLREGSLTVSVARPAGGFAVLRSMEPGEVVGIIGLVAPESVRQATVVAGAECLVSHLSRAAYLALVHGDPEAACAFRLVLARQLVHDLRRVDDALRNAVTTEDDSVPLHTLVPG